MDLGQMHDTRKCSLSKSNAFNFNGCNRGAGTEIFELSCNFHRSSFYLGIDVGIKSRWKSWKKLTIKYQCRFAPQLTLIFSQLSIWKIHFEEQKKNQNLTSIDLKRQRNYSIMCAYIHTNGRTTIIIVYSSSLVIIIIIMISLFVVVSIPRQFSFHFFLFWFFLVVERIYVNTMYSMRSELGVRLTYSLFSHLIAIKVNEKLIFFFSVH